MKKQYAQNTQTDSRDAARTAQQADGDRESVAVPSNTATNNSNTDFKGVKFLRFGVDSLYLSYQGNLYPEVNQTLADLKKLAQSDRLDQQAKAQYKLGDHLFEVKDKGSSMFSYILEDNAFRISLSRPNKVVPMAYIKISSEYLTYKHPADAEKHLYELLTQLGQLDSSAHVSRIDLFVDFVSSMDMESWSRAAWVTRAASVTQYAIDNRFTGWAIGLGGVMAARLYDKYYEILSSGKGYLIPLWKAGGLQEGEPVWRLEFEFKREILTQKGIIKLSEVLANLNGLWSYATTEWLKLTIPNAEDKTRARWPIHPLWAALATVDWETSGGELKSRFNLDRSPNDQAAFDRALSALTTCMAANAVADYDRAIHQFFIGLDSHINNKAMNVGLSDLDFVAEKVGIKARAFNTIDNNANLQDLEADAEAYRRASDGE